MRLQFPILQHNTFHSFTFTGWYSSSLLLSITVSIAPQASPRNLIMRSFTVLLTLIFAFVTTSYASIDFQLPTLEVRKDRNSTKHHAVDPTKMMCKKIKSLTALTSLAANQTKLDEMIAKGKWNANKVETLKAKAADAMPKLQALTANTTLTTDCAAINAKDKMKKKCGEMKKLQNFANLATNTTAMDAFVAKHKLNSTQVDKVKAEFQMAQTKLKSLQANTTVTDFCKQMKQSSSQGGSATMGAGTTAASGSAQQVSKSGASVLQSFSCVLVTVAVGVFAVFL
jgi:hypothetical protein